MKKVNKSDIFCLIFLFISLISFFIGFILNEDLSTGGASWDFDLTWNILYPFEYIEPINFQVQWSKVNCFPITPQSQ